jgi:hypothetical protein
MVKYTKEEIKEAKKKLYEDCDYFIEGCLYIINKKDRSRVPFILNPMQRKYSSECTNMDIILKARKEGFSSYIAAKFLHACIFHKNIRAVIISHESEATKRLLERVRYYIKNCTFKIPTEKNSEHEISFPETNSTFYIGTAGQKAFGRGDDITHAHLSEYCFYETPDILTSVQEAGTNNLQIVLESTANGAGTFSHQLWLNAIRKLNDFKPHFYAWWHDPEYCNKDNSPMYDLSEEEVIIKKLYNLSFGQIRWRREKIRKMLLSEKFVQEFPACWEEAFMTSGKMIFNYKSLQEQEASMLPVKWECDVVEKNNKIEFDISHGGPLRIWYPPKEDGSYLITSDSSQGIKGGDNSCADVFDMETWQQVAQFRGYVNPYEFGDKLFILGLKYNNAVLMPETNSPGSSTYERLEQLGYTNLWYDVHTMKPWRTTTRTRSNMITATSQCINDKSIKINSIDTINECRTFVLTRNKKFEAASGCYDDCVVSLSLACYALQALGVENEMRKKPKRNLLHFFKKKYRINPKGENYVGTNEIV